MCCDDEAKVEKQGGTAFKACIVYGSCEASLRLQCDSDKFNLLRHVEGT